MAQSGRFALHRRCAEQQRPSLAPRRHGISVAPVVRCPSAAIEAASLEHTVQASRGSDQGPRAPSMLLNRSQRPSASGRTDGP